MDHHTIRHAPLLALLAAALAACSGDAEPQPGGDSADLGTERYECSLQAHEGDRQEQRRFSFVPDCTPDPIGFCKVAIAAEGQAAGAQSVELTIAGGVHLTTTIDRFEDPVISIFTVAETADGTLLGSGQGDVDLAASHVATAFTVVAGGASSTYLTVCERSR